MIWVADSGSTKTDWRAILDDGSFLQCETEGLNPVFTTDDQFVIAIESVVSVLKSNEPVEKVFFYGSGCGSPERNARVTQLLQGQLPSADVEVHSDMLAAVRATCGLNEALVAILGTGMNSAYAQNGFIQHNLPSLGYILGDQGSGSYLGKMFLTDYLSLQLPESIKTNFERRYTIRHNDIIEALYRGPQPNRFLAQFARFIYQNLKHEYCYNLVVKAFNDFFESQIKQYEQHPHLPLHLCGSVAFYFSNILRRVAHEKGIHVGTILEKPIAGLALFHAEN